MSFFELPPERDEEDEEETAAQPSWAGPGCDELGVEVPLHLLVGESDQALVALQSITAYEQGLVLHLAARAKREPVFPTEPHDFDVDDDDDQFNYMNPRSPKFVRFGVQFADGRKVTNLELAPEWWDEGSVADPEGPLLIGHPNHDGWSGSLALDLDYWLWPLPPPPQLRVVVEWPAEGIEETSLEIDTEPLLEACRANVQV